MFAVLIWCCLWWFCVWIWAVDLPVAFDGLVYLLLVIVYGRVDVLWIRFACLILFVDLGAVIITVDSGFVGLSPWACLFV